jgi:hypothetical protein
VLALVNKWIDEVEALGASYVPPDAPSIPVTESQGNTTAAQP